jgi:NTP pyrophosphatase (non-canonical NTP hydrolase)
MKKRNTNMALVKLMEECGELTQICSKTIFYGKDSRSPKKKDSESNAELLVEEMGDVLALIKIIVEDTDLGISMKDIKARRDAKYIKLEGYVPEA